MATCPLCSMEVVTANGRFVPHGAKNECPASFAVIEKAHLDTEDRYTPPSELCPHPERWHSPDADSAESEVSKLVGAFVHALRPELVIETGTAWGFTAHVIGNVLADTKGVLHTIEPDPERVDSARQLCEGLPVVVEQMKSLDFVPPGPVGFAWFDSLLDLRVPEFEHFYDSLLDGAIVGFHDTAPHHGEGLWNDILGLEAQGKLLPIRLRTPRGVVFAEVVHDAGRG